jgi:hypothetical protein
MYNGAMLKAEASDTEIESTDDTHHNDEEPAGKSSAYVNPNTGHTISPDKLQEIKATRPPEQFGAAAIKAAGIDSKGQVPFAD